MQHALIAGLTFVTQRKFAVDDASDHLQPPRFERCHEYSNRVCFLIERLQFSFLFLQRHDSSRPSCGLVRSLSCATVTEPAVLGTRHKIHRFYAAAVLSGRSPLCCVLQTLAEQAAPARSDDGLQPACYPEFPQDATDLKAVVRAGARGERQARLAVQSLVLSWCNSALLGELGDGSTCGLLYRMELSNFTGPRNAAYGSRSSCGKHAEMRKRTAGSNWAMQEENW